MPTGANHTQGPSSEGGRLQRQAVWLAPLGGLALLTAAIVGYFLLYLPAQRAAYHARSQRVLTAMAGRTEAVFDNLPRRLSSSLRPREPPCAEPECSDSGPADQVVPDVPGVLRVEQEVCTAAVGRQSVSVIPEGSKDALARYRIEVKEAGGVREIASCVVQVDLQRYVSATLENGFLDPGRHFDSVLLVRGRGDRARVVYRSRDDGVVPTHLAPILGTTVGSLSNLQGDAGSRAPFGQVSVGPSRYWAYGLSVSAAPSFESEAWSLVALTEPATVDRAIRRWPTDLILLLVLALSVSLAAPSILKPVLVEKRQRFCRRDVHLLLFACTLLLMLATLTAGALTLRRSLQQVQVNQAQDAAEQMAQALATYVDEARDYLCSERDPRRTDASKPPFLQHAWIAQDGWQVAKAAHDRDSPPTPYIFVGDRGYYLDAKSTQPRPHVEGPDADPDDVLFHTVMSRNTGESLVMIGIPGWACPPQSRPDTFLAQLSTSLCTIVRDNDNLGFLGCGSQKAGRPPGFQFAVADRSGRVVMHPERHRELNENLLLEMEHATEVKALLASPRGGFATALYEQRPHVVYAQPIAHTPWVAVVMADRAVASHTVAAVVLRAAVISLWLLIAVAGVTLLASFVGPRSPALLRAVFGIGGERWMWPDLRRQADYCAALVGLLLLAAGQLLLNGRLTGWSGAFALAFGPVAALMLCFQLFSAGRDRSQEGGSTDHAADAAKSRVHATYRLVASVFFLLGVVSLGGASSSLFGVLGSLCLMLGFLPFCWRLSKSHSNRADQTPRADWVPVACAVLVLVNAAVIPCLNALTDSEQLAVRAWRDTRRDEPPATPESPSPFGCGTTVRPPCHIEPRALPTLADSDASTRLALSSMHTFNWSARPATCLAHEPHCASSVSMAEELRGELPTKRSHGDRGAIRSLSLGMVGSGWLVGVFVLALVLTWLVYRSVFDYGRPPPERTSTTHWSRRKFDTFDDDEQFVLANLVLEGFVGPRAWPTVRALEEEGVLERDPQLRIRHRGLEHQVKRWLAQREGQLPGERPSTWGSSFEKPVIIVVVLLALVVFTAQPAMLAWFAPLLTVLTALSAGVSKFFVDDDTRDDKDP